MSETLYLVTGAAGFLGSHVCHQLLERGEKVRAFVLDGDPAIKYIPKEAEIVKGDLCDIDSLENFFKAPEGTETIVLHVASMVSVNPDFNQKLVDVNVGGTKNIIQKCLEHKECKNLVYVSSTGAIPELPKGQKIKEVNEFDAEKVVGMVQQDQGDGNTGCFGCSEKGRIKRMRRTPEWYFRTDRTMQWGRLQEPLLKSSMAKCRSAWAEV